ncbi:probable E3 ubiquitin-protein ligase makorin-1 [Folsomia candida]|uniref:RING-type E3 ubiquitin transferase n=1 Tax=Folsomia candida TaxID=158441 RepID=A0A226E4L6_FOLCA|nr:probable E3 ubiquitin-protein ligase makorin-1 [Folsomia candida]XP_021954115.1 probable E3 ubiquitin-protein ligase makorin-1 [Folsomia candida]XP_035708931.1 probable E3 ubiquitin-protein ligase makorin-1 [Folsomia candida]OXA52682.1 putative E3 ubiquitin-protein ligase makorin-1 [Folsomia candida]
MSADEEKVAPKVEVPKEGDGLSEMIESARKSIEFDLQLTKSPNSENELSEQDRAYENWLSDVIDNPAGSSNEVAAAATTTATKPKSFVPPANWANAPEFVPRSFANLDSQGSNERSYAEVAGACALPELPSQAEDMTAELCPYAMVGECRFGRQCVYVHGMKCDFCGMLCLHPSYPDQRKQHFSECVSKHEHDMELAFAVARSNGKTCGICMEVIMEKTPPGEQRFGILPSCIHCYCLSCIRTWRQARQFENKIIRACPECRVTSDYVCPSRYWVEKKEDKEKLIQSYLESLSKKDCRYYQNGSGECPFGNKCFYLHAGPDGRNVDVGPPRRRIRRQDANGVASDSNAVSIWEFLEQWELQWFEIEDFMDMMDSDDQSIWSDDDDDFETLGYSVLGSL